MSDQTIILWLFAMAIATLLCVAVRTQYRIAGRLRKPSEAETAAGVAALAAAFAVLF